MLKKESPSASTSYSMTGNLNKINGDLKGYQGNVYK